MAYQHKDLASGRWGRLTFLEQCVDFTIGMTIKSVILNITEMLKDGIVFNQIYLPDTMFIVGGRFDLNGDSVDLIKKTFPDIKVNVIKIPLNMLHEEISLDACFRYFIGKGDSEMATKRR